MDDADVLEALRECTPATTDRIAERLSAPVDVVDDRLAVLEEDGRVEREREREGEGAGDGEWTIVRDPRLEESVDRMSDRLGRERR